MCTVTWLRADDSYQVFCNRDEKLSRRPSASPRHGTRCGVGFVAPIDGDFGGTWIATNEFGVTLCLLNGANLSGIDATERKDSHRSRGLLIPALVGARSVDDGALNATTRDLSQFAPFTLVVLERARLPAIVEWNGQQTLVEFDGDAYLPLASSSVNGETARKKRQQEYHRLVGRGVQPTVASLLEFHRSHGLGPGPYSTCMHRDDAETVSFTHVRVTASQATMFHSRLAPCRQVPGTTAKLNLCE